MKNLFCLLVALVGAVSLVAGQTSEKEIIKSEGKSLEDMLIFLGAIFVVWFILFVVPAAWKRFKGLR